MTHSGIKTAQKNRNNIKKENNNKDYREKRKGQYRFGVGQIPFDYILRTKYGICLNNRNKTFIEDNYVIYRNRYAKPIEFDEHTEEENYIIQEELKRYYNNGEHDDVSVYVCSRDKTHSSHSKQLTNNINKARDYKIELQK